MSVEALFGLLFLMLYVIIIAAVLYPQTFPIVIIYSLLMPIFALAIGTLKRRARKN